MTRQISGTGHPAFANVEELALCEPGKEIAFEIHLRHPALDALIRGGDAGAVAPLVASEETRAAVMDWATVVGFRPDDAGHGPLTLAFHGSAGKINAAFGIKLVEDAKGGQQGHGHADDYTLPEHVAGAVAFVTGLDTRPLAEPHLRAHPDAASGQSATLPSYAVPDVAKMYNFPTSLDGTGQKIAIVELGGGYRSSDLDAYFAKYGLKTPSIKDVGISGGKNDPGTNHNNDSEVTLDIEIVGAVASGAEYAIYFVPNYAYSYALAIQTILADKTFDADFITISWGGAESRYNAQSKSMTESYAKLAAAHGVTVICSSGDTGANDGTSAPVANFPAAVPEVLSCGGTSITVEQGRITDEVVWDNLQYSWGGASGGGISDAFAVPAYQAAITLPKSPSGNAGRGVPDVSANGDPLTGYSYYCDGKWSFVGGTSAAVPLWAGLLARINQGVGSSVGAVNAALYEAQAQARGAFKDVTQGQNGYYKAGVGWDACTGLGVPDGDKIYQYLKARVSQSSGS